MDSPDFSKVWDEIDLNPQALRELDRKVEAWTIDASRSSKRVSPPPKRVKLNHGHNLGPVVRDTVNDFDDLPDITLQGDGFYNVNNSLSNQSSVGTEVDINSNTQDAATHSALRKPVSHPARTSAPRQQPIAGPSSRVMTRNKSGPAASSQRTSQPMVHSTHSSDAALIRHSVQPGPNGVGTNRHRPEGHSLQERAALRPSYAGASHRVPRHNDSPLLKTQYPRAQHHQSKSPLEREVASLKRMLGITTRILISVLSRYSMTVNRTV